MGSIAVVQFPGSNCDLDAFSVLREVLRTKTSLVWHRDLKIDKYDAYVLPGGFTYGDYLRAGVIAAQSPSLEVINSAAKKNKPVLGICNGFQILIEAGLLPGAIVRNSGLRFVCKWTLLRVESTETSFTSLAKRGQILRIPVAHNEGRYYVDAKEREQLEKNGQVVFRYVNDIGETTDDANPNGSVDNIAGICNPQGNVMGLMPHPERASLSVLSPSRTPEGRLVFDSMSKSLKDAEAIVALTWPESRVHRSTLRADRWREIAEQGAGPGLSKVSEPISSGSHLDDELHRRRAPSHDHG